jgi:hypothetical protein
MFRILQAGYQLTLAPQPYTVRYKRHSGQISDIPLSEFLYTSIPLRSRIVKYLLANPALVDNKTVDYVVALYKLYTRLRWRHPVYARQLKKENIDPVIKSSIHRSNLMLQWFRLKSDLYVSYRMVKKAIGWRGLLGKISGMRQQS